MIKQYSLRERPCRSCGEFKAKEDFFWFAYTTNQGKRSKRKDPDCKACVAIENSKRYQANQERSAAISKAWRERNQDHCKAQAAAYRASVKGKRMRAKSQAARQARSKAGMIGAEDPRVLDLYQQARDWDVKLAACVECDDPLEMKTHVDHIIPLVKGGAHAFSNMQLLSARSNLEKGIRV